MLSTNQKALLSIGVLFVTAQAYADPVDSNAAVAAHNEWRAKVNVPALAWSASLATKAEQWAMQLQQQNCQMKHSGPGENLYWAGPKKTATSKDASGNWIWNNALQSIDPAAVVKAWGDEVQWYNYASNSCNAPAGKACGHYTQVVWKNTTEVGCAKAICADKSQVWVCNYAPAGNLVGSKPY